MRSILMINLPLSVVPLSERRRNQRPLSRHRISRFLMDPTGNPLLNLTSLQNQIHVQNNNPENSQENVLQQYSAGGPMAIPF